MSFLLDLSIQTRRTADDIGRKHATPESKRAAVFLRQFSRAISEGHVFHFQALVDALSRTVVGAVSPKRALANQSLIEVLGKLQDLARPQASEHGQAVMEKHRDELLMALRMRDYEEYLRVNDRIATTCENAEIQCFLRIVDRLVLALQLEVPAPLAPRILPYLELLIRGTSSGEMQSLLNREVSAKTHASFAEDRLDDQTPS